MQETGRGIRMYIVTRGITCVKKVRTSRRQQEVLPRDCGPTMMEICPTSGFLWVQYGSQDFHDDYYQHNEPELYSDDDLQLSNIPPFLRKSLCVGPVPCIDANMSFVAKGSTQYVGVLVDNYPTLSALLQSDVNGARFSSRRWHASRSPHGEGGRWFYFSWAEVG